MLATVFNMMTYVVGAGVKVSDYDSPLNEASTTTRDSAIADASPTHLLIDPPKPVPSYLPQTTFYLAPHIHLPPPAHLPNFDLSSTAYNLCTSLHYLGLVVLLGGFWAGVAVFKKLCDKAGLNLRYILLDLLSWAVVVFGFLNHFNLLSIYIKLNPTFTQLALMLGLLITKRICTNSNAKARQFPRLTLPWVTMGLGGWMVWEGVLLTISYTKSDHQSIVTGLASCICLALSSCLCYRTILLLVARDNRDKWFEETKNHFKSIFDMVLMKIFLPEWESIKSEVAEAVQSHEKLKLIVHDKKATIARLRGGNNKMSSLINHGTARYNQLQAKCKRLVAAYIFIFFLLRQACKAVVTLREAMEQADSENTRLKADLQNRDSEKSTLQSSLDAANLRILEIQNAKATELEEVRKVFETDLGNVTSERDEHAATLIALEKYLEKALANRTPGDEDESHTLAETVEKKDAISVPTRQDLKGMVWKLKGRVSKAKAQVRKKDAKIAELEKNNDRVNEDLQKELKEKKGELDVMRQEKEQAEKALRNATATATQAETELGELRVSSEARERELRDELTAKEDELAGLKLKLNNPGEADKAPAKDPADLQAEIDAILAKQNPASGASIIPTPVICLPHAGPSQPPTLLPKPGTVIQPLAPESSSRPVSELELERTVIIRPPPGSFRFPLIKTKYPVPPQPAPTSTPRPIQQGGFTPPPHGVHPMNGQFSPGAPPHFQPLPGPQLPHGVLPPNGQFLHPGSSHHGQFPPPGPYMAPGSTGPANPYGAVPRHHHPINPAARDFVPVGGNSIPSHGNYTPGRRQRSDRGRYDQGGPSTPRQ